MVRFQLCIGSDVCLSPLQCCKPARRARAGAALEREDEKEKEINQRFEFLDDKNIRDGTAHPLTFPEVPLFPRSRPSCVPLTPRPQNPSVRAANGRRKDDPDYDGRTISVPTGMKLSDSQAQARLRRPPPLRLPREEARLMGLSSFLRPLFLQYWAIKKKYADTVLFFKVTAVLLMPNHAHTKPASVAGDRFPSSVPRWLTRPALSSSSNLQIGAFYELYQTDADIGAQELGWKLTISGVGRWCVRWFVGLPSAAPAFLRRQQPRPPRAVRAVCWTCHGALNPPYPRPPPLRVPPSSRQVGCPERRLDAAIAALVAKGYKVGRVDQLETALQAKERAAKGKGKAVIERELTEARRGSRGSVRRMRWRAEGPRSPLLRAGADPGDAHHGPLRRRRGGPRGAGADCPQAPAPEEISGPRRPAFPRSATLTHDAPSPRCTSSPSRRPAAAAARLASARLPRPAAPPAWPSGSALRIWRRRRGASSSGRRRRKGSSRR